MKVSVLFTQILGCFIALIYLTSCSSTLTLAQQVPPKDKWNDDFYIECDSSSYKSEHDFAEGIGAILGGALFFHFADDEKIDKYPFSTNEWLTVGSIIGLIGAWQTYESFGTMRQTQKCIEYKEYKYKQLYEKIDSLK